MGFKYGNWIQAMCVFAVAVWFGRVRSPSDRVRKRAFDMPLGRFSQQKVHFFIRSIPFSTELWFDSHAPSVYCLRDWGAAMVALHWFISIASNQKSPILSNRLFFFFFFFFLIFVFCIIFLFLVLPLPQSFSFVCLLQFWDGVCVRWHDWTLLIEREHDFFGTRVDGLAVKWKW